MGYTPVPVENLSGGINLRDQPAMENPAFALDCLDMDFDGNSIRTRDGYTQFSAGVGAESYTSLHPYYHVDGTRQIIAGIEGGNLRAFNSSGTSIATAVTTDPTQKRFFFASFGGETETAVYIARGDEVALVKWNGTAFVAPTWTGPITPKPYFLGVTPWDNRLVGGAFAGSPQIEGNNYSTVRFSEPGDPENWQDNFVDLTPGDGEGINGIVAWREYVFVFKRTKFFVFYGTSSTEAGTPEFNYRTVNAGVGCLRSPVAGPDGVYFLADRGSPGVYKTTGADPQLVSGPLDPIFHHEFPPFSALEPINFSEGAANAAKYRMTVWQKRILLNVPIGTSATRTFVFDPRTGAWVPWDLPLKAFTPFSITSDEDLIFSSDANSKLFRFSPNYTDDNGVAIASFWQSGWITGGSELRKQMREWKLWGSGTVTFKVGVNYRTDYQTTDSVVFGNVPVAQKLSRLANRGHAFSMRFEGAAPFSISKAVGHLREVSVPTKIT